MNRSIDVVTNLSEQHLTFDGRELSLVAAMQGLHHDANTYSSSAENCLGVWVGRGAGT